MNDYDATGGEQGWIMKSKLNELRLDAGIARIENQKWLCVLDKETGMMIDPMIGLEKFAELIVRECAKIVTIWSDEKPCSEGYDIHSVAKMKEHFGVEE
jgi:hypothetical protein